MLIVQLTEALELSDLKIIDEAIQEITLEHQPVALEIPLIQAFSMRVKTIWHRG